MMKQNLQLKQTQQLSMTQQLQQAIRLLQLSTIELQQEIHIALETNPLLELEDPFDSTDTSFDGDTDEFFDLNASDSSHSDFEELPMESSWDDIYPDSRTPSSNSENHQDEFGNYSEENSPSLYESLMWQLSTSAFNEEENVIAAMIIGALDEAGYLTLSIKEIKESLLPIKVSLKQIENVLQKVQLFEPSGVAARNLQECLTLQLKQLEANTPYRNESLLIVEKHLSLIAEFNMKTLIKQSGFTEALITQAMLLIRSLTPKPGLAFGSEHLDYVIPDIFIHKKQNLWVATLNPHALPHLSINQYYANLADTNKADTQFIKHHLQEAKWLIKSIENRNSTLLKVAQAIVGRQQAFFENGHSHMKAMILEDIAEQIEMHESTISRATTQKYLYCSHGLFELKYYFSSHLSSESGEQISSTAIRALIQELITNEDSKKPLSDSKIMQLFEKKGIIVARRTIAKYRDSLSIPPSSQRKTLL